MKLFRKTDIIVVLVVLAVAAGGWAAINALSAGAAVQAEIYLGQEKRLTIALTEGVVSTLSLPERPEVILEFTQDGAIRFASSNCPDKVCIHAGKLDTPGQSAACLPNEVIVKIVQVGGRSENKPDLIVG